jgi:FixJ family two-component response regulator
MRDIPANLPPRDECLGKHIHSGGGRRRKRLPIVQPSAAHGGLPPGPFSQCRGFLSDRNRPHFNCLVFDVQLEGISGIELWHRLAAVGDTTPVIFITAHDNDDSRIEAESSGCAGYFRKTDPCDTILGTIRNAVNSNSNSTTNPLPS